MVGHMVTPGKTYKVDVRALHATCEANFARLQPFLPATLPKGRPWHFLSFWPREGVSCTDKSLIYTGVTTLQVLEKSRYTSTIHLRHKAGWASWLQLPEIVVRVYHDVKMAEVIRMTGPMGAQAHLFGRYDYPNRNMLQQDEKYQWNYFFGEWLGYCLRKGQLINSSPLFSR
jgi:uncharacterized protein YqiB (DUF1249 family)